MHDEQDLKCRTGRAGISSEPISNEPPEERLIKNHYEEVWAGRGPAVPAIVCTLAFEADSKRLLARADRSASLLDCDILDRIRLVGLTVSLEAYMMINAWRPLQHFTQPAAAPRRALAEVALGGYLHIAPAANRDSPNSQGIPTSEF